MRKHFIKILNHLAPHAEMPERPNTPADPIHSSIRSTMEILAEELGFAQHCLTCAETSMRARDINELRLDLEACRKLTSQSLALLDALIILARCDFTGEFM